MAVKSVDGAKVPRLFGVMWLGKPIIIAMRADSVLEDVYLRQNSLITKPNSASQSLFEQASDDKSYIERRQALQMQLIKSKIAINFEKQIVNVTLATMKQIRKQAGDMDRFELGSVNDFTRPLVTRVLGNVLLSETSNSTELSRLITETIEVRWTSKECPWARLKQWLHGGAEIENEEVLGGVRRVVLEKVSSLKGKRED